MRILFFCFTTTIILISTVACNHFSDDLSHAEQLLDNKPDSALRLLKTIPVQKLFFPSDKALYAFLYCRALEKQNINIESDSLINVATEYYNENEPLRAGYAWLIKVHIAQNNKNASEQAQFLFKADEFSKLACDNKLNALIYYEKAKLLFNQRQFAKAISYFKVSAAYFVKTNQQRSIVLSNLHIGYSYLYLQKPDIAEKYYQRAENTAIRLNDRELLSVILKSIGALYFERSDYLNALKCFYEAPLVGIKVYDSNKYYLIADAYIKLNQFDSAKFYMHKVKVLTEIGTDYYRLWQHIYEKEGNATKAIYYADKVVMATDSLYKQKLQVSFDGLEKKYNYQKLQLANQQLIIKDKQNSVYLLLCILIIAGFATTFLLWRLRLKQQKLATQSQILKQERALYEKEKENSSLLTKKLEFQKILITNIDLHRKNTVKRPGLWKSSSGQIVVEQNEALHKELTAHVDLEYNNFTLRLKDQFQVLTERDLFFCCLLLAKFETGMIATVLDVNIESVNKHRHRLRKKLQVSDSTENLVDFLRNF
jgi:hypothetical protein